MCGRFAFYSPREAVTRTFGIEFPAEPEARFNIAPSQYVAAIRGDKTGILEPAMLRWGLIPSWAKDMAIGNRTINARAETVHQKPAYRSAFRRRRCVVLADGFYEWRKTDSGKIPHYVTTKSDAPFAMAGLWERWEVDGSLLETCTIITTAANRVIAPLHERMPVILSSDDVNRWIEPTTGSADESFNKLQALLEPCSDELLHFWAVKRLVNNPAHEGPELIEPD